MVGEWTVEDEERCRESDSFDADRRRGQHKDEPDRDDSGRRGHEPMLTYERHATCDGCSESAPVRLADPDDGNSPYICEQCDRQVIRATNEAAVVLAHELGHTLASFNPPMAAPNTFRIAELVISTYLAADIRESENR